MNSAQGSVTSALNVAGRFLGGVTHQAWSMVSSEPPTEVEVMEMPVDNGFIGDIHGMVDLSYSQRLVAFFTVLSMGIVFLVIAALFAPTVALFPKKFAFFLTIGNIFCLGSTILLAGVKKQMDSLFCAKRFEAGLTFVASLILTLMSALYWKSSVFALFFSVVQVCSMLWYALSFVPFMRTVVSTLGSYCWRAVNSLTRLAGMTKSG
uniref:Vesicle transport protein n=1 Tax=Trypanosoma congolense (strain IL3000) TaxID=1068625 RepID=G0UK40_TRYCI|nr:conserved hypothetical protein [Trypanosoma congolense IL3000]